MFGTVIVSQTCVSKLNILPGKEDLRNLSSPLEERVGECHRNGIEVNSACLCIVENPVVLSWEKYDKCSYKL